MASLAEAALEPQSHEGKQGMLWLFSCDGEQTRGLLGIVELCRKHSTLESLLVIRVPPAQARADEVAALHWRYRGVVLVLHARRQPQVFEPNGRARVAGAGYVAQRVLRQTESRDPYQAIETPPATLLPRWHRCCGAHEFSRLLLQLLHADGVVAALLVEVRRVRSPPPDLPGKSHSTRHLEILRIQRKIRALLCRSRRSTLSRGCRRQSRI